MWQETHPVYRPGGMEGAAARSQQEISVSKTREKGVAGVRGDQHVPGTGWPAGDHPVPAKSQPL